MAKVNSKTETTTRYELTLSEVEMEHLEKLLGADSDPQTYEIYEAIVDYRAERRGW
jgi:hypothetical protein